MSVELVPQLAECVHALAAIGTRDNPFSRRGAFILGARTTPPREHDGLHAFDERADRRANHARGVKDRA